MDELWNGGPKLIQSDNVFRLGTDSVLLAHWPRIAPHAKVCDVGCGSGVISIIIASMHDCNCTGVDIQTEACELARRNVEINLLGGRVEIVQGDIRQHRGFLEAGSFDNVISNPPYYEPGHGKTAESGNIAIARTGSTCSLEDVISAAAYLCRWGGSFAMVQKPEVLATVMSLMVQYKLEPKRLRMVCHREGAAPNLFLIEGKRGGKPGLTVEKTLVITGPDGSETPEVKAIYHRDGLGKI